MRAAPRRVKSRPLRWALIGVGLISLGLGAGGVMLPLLPTTPFLLLSALCFAKASDRLLDYLMGHRVFGSYLHQYYSGQMTMAYKLQTLGVMWLGLVVSAWIIGKPWPWAIFAVIGTGVSIHILTLKPKTPPAPPSGERTTTPGE
ncbi:YbaN family protein [uncultured Corynebacterium sp.]|uniref:YbaN family protein n=1 Tax=uncultured Corynebacterium sp. TaxID=159447 RepID=UPI0025DC1D4F|nr:YbaN family protein [uncultured Corynebacterium sp.]